MDVERHKVHGEIEAVKGMISRDDFASARERLRKLQLEHPAIDNIGMIAACDILRSASFDILAGEIDWYWVLQVSQSSSEQEIESRYNKLVKLLSPITDNPSAEAALKIVENAYSILSNPVNRSDFDIKRRMKLESYEFGKPKKIHLNDSGNRVQSSNVFLTSSEFQREDFKVEYGKHFSVEEATAFSTFNKRGATVGTEETPSNKSSPSNSLHSVEGLSKFMTSVSMTNCAQEAHNFTEIRKAEDFEVGQVWAIYDHENLPRSYIQIESIDKGPIRLHVNRLKPAPIMNRQRWPVVCGLFYVDASETLTIEPADLSHILCDYAGKQVEIYPREQEVWAICKDWEAGKYCSDFEVENNSALEVVEIVSGNFNEDIIVAKLIKVKGRESVFRRYTEKGSDNFLSIPVEHLAIFCHSISAERIVGGEMDGMLHLDPYAIPELLTNPETMDNNPSNAETTALLNRKWSTKDFVPNQVWAVYDGPDGMPRRYVVVNQVASESEICVTVLDPSSILDFQTQWDERDIPFACGLFEVGSNRTNLPFSRFSHMVNAEPTEDNYGIYPREGEVLAMYRKWSWAWEYSDFTDHECLIVEIVEDFTDGARVVVANLVEVPGYTTFFQRELRDGFELVKEVPTEKLLYFSHQIPAYRVPAVQELGVPEGSWHLEPDALPPSQLAGALI